MPKAGRIVQAGGKNVDYYEISMKQFSAADSAHRPARHHCLGLRCRVVRTQKRTVTTQCPIADHRGQVEHAGARQVDQRSQGRERQLPAPPAASRSDPALGQPARRSRSDRPRHDGRPSPINTQSATPVRCRSSRTSTARWAWAMNRRLCRGLVSASCE